MPMQEVPGSPIDLVWTEAGHAAKYVYVNSATGLLKQAAALTEVVDSTWLIRNTRNPRNGMGVFISTAFTGTASTFAPEFATASTINLFAAPDVNTLEQMSLATVAADTGGVYITKGGTAPTSGIALLPISAVGPAGNIATTSQYGSLLWFHSILGSPLLYGIRELGFWLMFDPQAAPAATSTWTVRVRVHEVYA